MEAGRNLDDTIAQKMGWTVQLIINAQDASEEWRDPHGWRYGPNPKPYSTEISATWEVVEYMGRDGFDFSLWRSENGQRAMAGFNCSFGPCEKHGNPYDDWHGSRDVPADSVELAICKAALAALGYET